MTQPKFSPNQYVYLGYGSIEYIEYIVTDCIPTGSSYMYAVYDYVSKSHKEISEENLYSADEIKFKPTENQVVVDFVNFAPYFQ